MELLPILWMGSHKGVQGVSPDPGTVWGDLAELHAPLGSSLSCFVCKPQLSHL